MKDFAQLVDLIKLDVLISTDVDVSQANPYFLSTEEREKLRDLYGAVTDSVNKERENYEVTAGFMKAVSKLNTTQSLT